MRFALITALGVSLTSTAAADTSQLRIQVRQLADQLADGLGKQGTDPRYQLIAVLPFMQSGDGELGTLVSAEVETVLRRDHNLLVVERARITEVIDELALGQSGLVDEAQAATAGKLLGANSLVIGSVALAGEKYLVNAKVVAVDSAAILVAQQAELPAADLVALSSEAVVLRSTSGAVFRSMIVPGWGQFYNRQPIKGLAFIGAELAGVALAVAFHALGTSEQADYRALEAGAGGEYQALRQQAERSFTLRNVFIYVTIALHALNVFDALMSGQSFASAAP